jgi:hypothetical protein
MPDFLNCRLAYTDKDFQEHTWYEVRSKTLPNGVVSITTAKWGRDGLHADPNKRYEKTFGLDTRKDALEFLDYLNPAIRANPTLLVDPDHPYPAFSPQEYERLLPRSA